MRLWCSDILWTFKINRWLAVLQCNPWSILVISTTSHHTLARRRWFPAIKKHKPVPNPHSFFFPLLRHQFLAAKMAKTVWTIRMVRSQKLLLKKGETVFIGYTWLFLKNTFNNQTIREKKWQGEEGLVLQTCERSGLIPKSLLLSQHMECKLRSLKFTWHIHSMSSTPGALCFPYGPADIRQSTPSTSYDLQQNHWSTSFHSIPVVTFLAEVPRLSLWNVNKHSIIQASLDVWWFLFMAETSCFIYFDPPKGMNLKVNMNQICSPSKSSRRPSFLKVASAAPGFFAREVARFLSLPVVKPLSEPLSIESWLFQ